MLRTERFISLFALIFLVVFSGTVQARHVDVIQINDSINPAVAEYISEAISRAQTGKAECLIIQLDTPGGLLTSTKQIVTDISESRIPVVVYISPRGAWAASAGTFITLASHIAVMAPSTSIGAAHPVSMMPSSGEKKDSPSQQSPDDRVERLEKKIDKFFKEMKSEEDVEEKDTEKVSGKEDKTGTASEKNSESADEAEEEAPSGEKDVMSEKIINTTTAWIRGIAEERGRNAEWAEKAVTESLSITETEAIEKNVVDLIAGDIDELLEKIHDKTVSTPAGEITLNTDKIQINIYEMTLRQKILSTISNPNLFFILVLLGPLGLVIELYNPGLILPGVVGGISIILLLYASQVLPVNYAAILLILLAIILFVAEVKIQSFGLLTLGGVICIILGGLMLFRTGPELPGAPFRVAYTTLFSVTAVVMAFIFVVLERVFRVHSQQATTGSQGIVGEIGTARSEVHASGRVFVHGELWNAVSEIPISKGAKIEVIDVKGLTLTVKEII